MGGVQISKSGWRRGTAQISPQSRSSFATSSLKLRRGKSPPTVTILSALRFPRSFGERWSSRLMKCSDFRNALLAGSLKDQPPVSGRVAIKPLQFSISLLRYRYRNFRFSIPQLTHAVIPEPITPPLRKRGRPYFRNGSIHDGRSAIIFSLSAPSSTKATEC